MKRNVEYQVWEEPLKFISVIDAKSKGGAMRYFRHNYGKNGKYVLVEVLKEPLGRILYSPKVSTGKPVFMNMMREICEKNERSPYASVQK